MRRPPRHTVAAWCALASLAAAYGFAATSTDTWDQVTATISAPDTAPALTDFDVSVEGRILNPGSFDVYAYELWENASWAYDASHRVTVTAGTLIDSSGFNIGTAYSQTYTFNRPVGIVTYTFVFGYRSSGHSWHDVAVEVPVTVGNPPPCDPATLPAVARLQGVRDGAGARFEWQAESAALEYHLNAVDRKDLVNPVDAHLPRVGTAEPACASPQPTCTDLDAIADSRRVLFYQVFAACGPDGADEGAM